MKKQTLAPAVLASLTAAGLVLAPVAAFAQDSDAQNVSLSDASADPTATPTQEPANKEQKTADEPATEKPNHTEEGTPPAPPSEGNKGADDGDSDKDESDDGGGTAHPTDEATATDEPTEEPTDDPVEDVDAADVTITPQDVDLTDVVYFSGEDEPAGATISATELEPNTQYDVTVAGGAEASGELQVTTDADGSFKLPYTIEVDSDADLETFAGDRSVNVADPDGETVAQGSFEVINDIEDDETEEDQADPALDVPSSIEVDDVMVPQGEEPGDRGLQIAATDLAPGERYTFRVIAPEDTPDLSTEFEVEADENGDAVGAYFVEWYGDYSADLIAGTYAIELAGEDEVLDSAEVEFTVGSDDDGSDDTDEDEDAGGDDSEDTDDPDDSDDGQPGEDDGDDSDDANLDPGITVSPENLSAANFMNFDKGVQVAASNCLPGDMVSLEVMWPGTDEVAYADGIEADDDGAASFSFYGTGSNAADYVGTWKVSITCGDETVTDSFMVTGSPGDDGDGDGGSELPRTGSDAGILAIAAAGLLTVGAATVMLSSRPKRRNTM